MANKIAFLMNRATPHPLRFWIRSAPTNFKPSKSSSILSMGYVHIVSATVIISGLVDSICTPSSDRLLGKLWALVQQIRSLFKWLRASPTVA
ncbi:unnamed protein product [Schistosoma haematobium]|nr:unnamed protein product [Schistosoma haematobium]